jgi:hypothetical protein
MIIYSVQIHHQINIFETVVAGSFLFGQRKRQKDFY